MGIAAGGALGIADLIGFGSSAPGVAVLGQPFSLTTAIGAGNLAFTMPRNGTITEISATFTAVGGTSLLGNTFANVQIYSAPQGSSLFSPLGTAPLQLTPPISTLAVNETVFGNFAVNFPLTQGDRIILAFGASSSGATVLVGSLTGYASAGITII